MEECKNCKSTETVKNGLVRQKQRYKCKSCGTTLCAVMNTGKNQQI